jgi:DNA-binding NarL/FixJ family response regulator
VPPEPGAGVEAVGRQQRRAGIREQVHGREDVLERRRAGVPGEAHAGQRQLRAEAQARLREALALAEDGGMRLLGQRARDELLGTGARPRRSALTGPGSLTPAEHRIAVLAAEGQSNRAIAERLYVTQRTVETHLTHVFAKLQITTRADLARAMEALPLFSAPGRG